MAGALFQCVHGTLGGRSVVGWGGDETTFKERYTSVQCAERALQRMGGAPWRWFCWLSGQWCLHAQLGFCPADCLSGSLCGGNRAVSGLLRRAGGRRCCCTRGCRSSTAALLFRPIKEHDDCGDVICARLALQPQLVGLRHQRARRVVGVVMLGNLRGTAGRGCAVSTPASYPAGLLRCQNRNLANTCPQLSGAPRTTAASAQPATPPHSQSPRPSGWR